MQILLHADFIKSVESHSSSIVKNSFYLDKKNKKKFIQIFLKAILRIYESEMSLSSRFNDWLPCAQQAREVPQTAKYLSGPIKAKQQSRKSDIFGAIVMGNIDFIQKAGRLGESFNFQDEDGITPLFWAVLNNNVEILNTLIQFSANPNTQDNDGDTALMQAAAKNYKKCVLSLLACKKIDINQRNKKGYHALSYGCMGGNQDIAEILLESGSDINLQDRWGRSIFVHLKFFNPSENHQSILAMMAKRLDPEALFMHKEILRLIALAQSTNGEGVSNLIHNNKSMRLDPIHLEGGLPRYWIKKMSKATQLFSLRYPELIDKTASTNLIHLLNSANADTSQELLERQRQGLPILINSGFQGHSVTVLMWGPYFALCNRGEASRKSTEVYRFNPEQLNANVIEKIKKIKHADEESYKELFFEALPSILTFDDKTNAQVIMDLEQACAYAPQISDNCSWASLEQAVLTFLIMNECFGNSEASPQVLDQDNIHLVKTKFEEWLAFNQMYHLERYLGLRYLRSENPEKQKDAFLRRKAFAVDSRLLLSSIASIIKTIPSCSKQIIELEQILGKTLFIPNFERRSV